MNHKLSRRSFVKISGLAVSGLLIGVNRDGYSQKPFSNSKSDSESFQPNIWLQIMPDETVTIWVAKAEMGQGVKTSLATIVAEELNADWNNVKILQADLGDGKYGYQQTGGSSSIRESWLNLRKAGAAAREMLVEAASRKWHVPASQCRTEKGKVIHSPSLQVLSYGELTIEASVLAISSDPPLKDTSNFTLIGKKVKRYEIEKIVSGSLKYGIDDTLPGMQYATVIKCPFFGGKLKNYYSLRDKDIGNRYSLFAMDGYLVAVADAAWKVLQVQTSINIEWEFDANSNQSSEDIHKYFLTQSEKSGVEALQKGENPEQWRTGKLIEANYSTSYVAHIPLEPPNCLVNLENDRCEIWVSTQAPEEARKIAAKISGLTEEKITIHTSPIGGSFGRRLEVDYIGEAVAIAKIIKKPVKLIYSREHDLKNDFYRPATFHKMKSQINKENKLVGYFHKLVAPSIIKQRWNELEATHGNWITKEGLDETAVLGANDFTYAIPNIRVEYVMANTPVPVSWWRGTYDSMNAFAKECFIDEIAHAMKLDPLKLRLSLLKNDEPSMRVLKLLAEKSQWKKKVAKGIFKGLAIHTTFNVPVGHVVELSLTKGKIKVHRVVSVIDCGLVVSPDMVKAQIEGSVIDGISTAFHSSITIMNGGVQESNFHNYKISRITDAPQIEVFAIPSSDPPRGVGEPAVPPVAPAIANALFLASGKRYRTLPFTN